MRRLAWQRVMVSAGISLMAVALTPFIFANTVFGQEDLQAGVWLAHPLCPATKCSPPTAYWFPQRPTMLNLGESDRWLQTFLSLGGINGIFITGLFPASQFSCRCGGQVCSCSWLHFTVGGQWLSHLGMSFGRAAV